MMTILIIAYIASVFVSRWLNKVAYRIGSYSVKAWSIWFIPVLNITGIAVFVAFGYLDRIKINGKFIKWFIGDNW